MNTPESQSFETHDRLGLKPFCAQLERYLLVEHDYVEGSLVVGLNAGFGAGKTTLLKMWESDLRSRRDSGKYDPMPLVLNAWESDYCGDPLMAILAGLMEAVDSWGNAIAEKDKGALREAAKDVGWFITGLANEFATKWTGVNIMAAGEVAEAKREARKEEVPDFVELYQKRTSALKNLKNTLAAVFGGYEPKAFVFVDELDRCRPDYAVSYLETIKHVFDVRGMVFVLAIDQMHLANSAKALFGQDLVFEEYFRKFCHRVIHLPEPDETGLKKLTQCYVGKYLSIEGKRQCGIQIADRRREIVELALCLKMQPRQLQEAFRIVGHFADSFVDGGLGRIGWCVGAAAILLAFLRVARPKIYESFKDQKMSDEEVGRMVVSIVGSENAQWWFSVYLSCRGPFSPATLEPEILMEKSGIWEEGTALATGGPGRGANLSKFRQGWDDFVYGETNGFQIVIKRIENVSSFSQD